MIGKSTLMWMDEITFLQEWADRNCQPVDLISSWTELVSVYKHLEFVDDLNDEQRIKEFKHVVRETNRLLTRVKNTLTTCRSIKDAIEYLSTQFAPSRNSDVTDRQDVAYQALKQRFLRQSIAEMTAVYENLFESEEEPEEEIDD